MSTSPSEVGTELEDQVIEAEPIEALPILNGACEVVEYVADRAGSNV